jgi:hypothetical protein
MAPAMNASAHPRRLFDAALRSRPVRFLTKSIGKARSLGTTVR